MRKFALTLAAAGAALGLAAPASAQWAPAYGYGYTPRVYAPAPAYGYAPAYAPRVYGYNGAAIGSLEARLAGVRSQIAGLRASGRLGFGQARSLERQAFNLDRQIRVSAAYGVGPGQQIALERRIANLERRVQIASLRGRYGVRRYAAYNPYYHY
jgi:hypothetical protein